MLGRHMKLIDTSMGTKAGILSVWDLYFMLYNFMFSFQSYFFSFRLRTLRNNLNAIDGFLGKKIFIKICSGARHILLDLSA